MLLAEIHERRHAPDLGTRTDVLSRLLSVTTEDSQHFDSPGESRPERFLEGGGPASGTWFSFGGGVRRRVGAGFSLVEATVVLRAVLSRLQIAPARARRERVRPSETCVPGRGARDHRPCR
ncbi:cytochrome P450 [Actinoplanes sp. NPDC048796]|uniref:cytochrome P450 n=1 Tax=Actinoplanes sp. NPDC048796 TaxID=3155640 RepID=UPI0033FBFB3C